MHHYAHRQENRLYKTACGVGLDVLAAVVWRRNTRWVHYVDVGIWLECQNSHSALSLCPGSTQPQPAHPG